MTQRIKKISRAFRPKTLDQQFYEHLAANSQAKFFISIALAALMLGLIMVGVQLTELNRETEARINSLRKDIEQQEALRDNLTESINQELQNIYDRRFQFLFQV